MRFDSVGYSVFGMVAAVTTLYIMSHHRILAMTPTASLNGTGATEAYLTINQNKTILARVLKVVEGTAIDTGHTLYTHEFFYS